MEDTSERTGEITELKGRLRALESRLESVEKLLGLGPRGTPVRFDPGLAEFASTADTGQAARPDEGEARGDELGSSAPDAAPGHGEAGLMDQCTSRRTSAGIHRRKLRPGHPGRWKGNSR